MKAKLLSILLVMSMTTSLIPAFAAENPAENAKQDPPQVEGGLYGEIEIPEEQAHAGEKEIAEMLEQLEGEQVDTPSPSPEAIQEPIGTEEPETSLLPSAPTDDPAEEETTQPDEKSEKTELQTMKALQRSDDGEYPQGIAIDEDYINNYKDQSTYSDESFYGKYDLDAEDWLDKGKLNYEYDDGMREIGEAVKYANGDYSQVKQMYLEYNRKKTQTQSREPIGDDSKLERLKAELMVDGHAGQYTLVDVMPVTEEESTISLDVTSQMQALRGKGSKYLLEFISRLKDGSRIAIASQDNGNESFIPYIEVVTNGAAKSYKAIADTTVRAGSNRSKSFGKEPALYACESKSSIGLRDMVDSNTERAMIQFDMSDLAAGQNITSATLYLRAQNVGDAGSYGELVVYEISTGSFTENFTWMSFKHRVFSNYGDRAISFEAPSSAANADVSGTSFTGNYREDIMNAVSTAAMSQYQYSGDEKYAYITIMNILGYINGRGRSPADVSTLRCGVRGQEFHRYLYRLIHSKYMNAEIFSHMIKWYYGQGQRLYEDWDIHPNIHTSNWGVTQTSGNYLVLMNMPEIQAYNTWRKASDDRFNILMDHSIYEDGACSEVSMGYTSYSLNGFSITQEYADEMGVSIPFTDFVKEGMVKLALYLARMTGPNYVDPQQGNCYNYTGSYIKHIQRVYNIIPDNPYIAHIATGGKKGRPLEETSVIYPVSKKVMMRSGWGDDDLYLQTNVDGGVKQHGHEDDLATNIFAYGRYLLIDPRYNNYGNDDPYRIWYNSTEGHNTVVINDMTQKGNSWAFSQSNIPNGGARGYIFDWETNNSYDFMKARTENFKNYPAAYTKGYGQGFNHYRSILFVKPNFWIVSDYAGPVPGSKTENAENNYRQLWHVLPNANVGEDQLSITENGIIGRTNYDDVNMQVVTPNDGTLTPELKDGWYSESGANYAVKYFSFGKTQKGNATFDTLLRPETTDNQAEIKSKKLELSDVTNGGASAARFVIDETGNNLRTDVSYYILHDETQKDLRQFGNYETDGSLAYVEKTNGKLSRIILQDAKTLKNIETGEILFQSDEWVSDISIAFSGDTIDISVGDRSEEAFVGETLDRDNSNPKKTWLKPEPVSLAALTFRTEKKPVAVKLNAISQDIKTSGQYVYFGNKPIIDGGSEPTPTPTQKPGPNTGGGGGHGTGGGGTAILPPVTTPAPPVSPAPTPDSKLSENMEKELAGHWAEKEITEMVEKGIVSGTGNDSLGLKQPTTRAEFTALLMRAAGLETVQYNGEFADVSAEDWYADTLAGAKKAGILNGDGVNANPNGIITREEMAVMLVNTCNLNEMNASTEHKNYSDMQDISPWARESVMHATELGLMSGMDEAHFMPGENALREQAIVVVYRLRAVLQIE